MAKIEQLEPRIFLHGQLAGASESAWRRSIMPSIRWGAVIAGVAVGLSLQLVLTLLGGAIGLSSLVMEGGNTGTASIIWLGIGMLAAASAGGFVAARMSGLRRKADGLLHGAVVWSVLTLTSAALAGYAGGPLLNAVPGGTMPMTVQTQDDDYSLALVLRGLIGGDVSVADMQTLERYMRSGQREEAILLLSAIGMDPVLAARVVDQAMIAVFQGQASSQSAVAGSEAAKSTQAAAWLAFGSVFLSLLLGMAGGLAGALGSRRQAWDKSAAIARKDTEYTSSPAP